MTPERWRRVTELFEAALERECARRAAFLAQAAGDDATLAEEVLRLLASDERAGAFLNEPPGLVSQGPSSAALVTVTAGRRIGPYRILREIGRGGMGAVYLAVRDDDQYQKQVAIKLVPGGLGSELVVERFKAERQILANLEHPNIARLIDGGTTIEGWPYFSMEYVEGKPIDQYCACRNLSTRERLELFLTACAAVQYAHQRLVIHRDLKPGNILVSEEGAVKLLDFGIAKLLEGDAGAGATLTALPLMTPDYASPEQVKGESITTASDVYSLGMLLYELLARRRAYQLSSRSAEEIARVVCQVEPDRPGAVAPRVLSRQLKGDLDTIVLTAMRKDPSRRYASVQELAQDIRQHLAGLPVQARGDTVSYRAGKFVRRHKAGVAAAALVVLSLLGGIIATARQARIAEANRARAERRFGDVRKLANAFLFEFHDAIRDLPGSTAARALVVKKALEYLDGLSRETAGDLSLGLELADAYQKLGDIQGSPFHANLGDLAEALASYRKSVSILESLRAAAPAAKDIRRKLAVRNSQIANLLLRSDDAVSALNEHRKVLALREELAAAEPGDVQLRRELAASYVETGYAQEVVGEVKEALESFRKALAIAQPLAAEHSDWRNRHLLATAYLTVGDALASLGELGAAVDSQRQALVILRELATAEPANAWVQRNLAASTHWLGTTLRKAGDLRAAQQHEREAIQISESLLAADPKNARFRRDLASSYSELGAILAQNKEFDEGLKYQRKAAMHFEKLAGADPSNAEALLAVSITQRRLGDCLLGQADVRGALDSYRDSVATGERVAAAVPKRLEAHYELAYSLHALGAAHERLARASDRRRADHTCHEARPSYERSLKIWTDVLGRAPLPYQYSKRPAEVSEAIARCNAVLGGSISAASKR